MRCLFVTSRMVRMLKLWMITRTGEVAQDWGSSCIAKILIICILLRKSVYHLVKMWNNNSTSRYMPKRSKNCHINNCIQIFITTLHNVLIGMEYYWAIDRNKIQIHTTVWMNLESIKWIPVLWMSYFMFEPVMKMF